MLQFKSRATNFSQLLLKLQNRTAWDNFYKQCKFVQECWTFELFGRPWLLLLEIKGYNDSQNLIPLVRTLFPLKVVSVQFNVTQDGASYDFVCSAFNDEA